jgi:hypothetical protein
MNRVAANKATQAPSRNFVTPAVMNTIAERNPPVALKARLRRQWASRSRHQCMTIPACDSVNARKTPTAKSGMSGAVSPPNPTKIAVAATESRRIPLVKARRSPIRRKSLGAKESRASRKRTRGKSL